MTRTLVALTLLSLAVHGYQPSQQTTPQLFAERSPSYSMENGILELRKSGGWLRTPRMHLDFVLVFEFTAMSPETDAGVIMRSWPGSDGWPNHGYRFRLPTDAGRDAAAAFEGRKKAMRVIEQGQVRIRPAGEWQQVEVTGAGRRVTVVMNDAVLGVFEVEEFVGHIMFDARDGRVQIRNIRISSRENTTAESTAPIRFTRLQELGGQVPKLIHHVGTRYTPDAMQRGVKGKVALEAIVLQHGAVHAVGIVRSLDPGLDQSAIDAIKRWKFQPGLLNGKPVPVLIDVEMSFTLEQ